MTGALEAGGIGGNYPLFGIYLRKHLFFRMKAKQNIVQLTKRC
jgi:hypothetical protein